MFWVSFQPARQMLTLLSRVFNALSSHQLCVFMAQIISISCAEKFRPPLVQSFAKYC